LLTHSDHRCSVGYSDYEGKSKSKGTLKKNTFIV